jgi:hypothetical protein
MSRKSLWIGIERRYGNNAGNTAVMQNIETIE